MDNHWELVGRLPPLGACKRRILSHPPKLFRINDSDSPLVHSMMSTPRQPNDSTRTPIRWWPGFRSTATGVFVIFLGLFSPLAPEANATVKVGFLGGFTGPVESVAPIIFSAAQLAATQINQQGGLRGGEQLAFVQGDTGCADVERARHAAQQLIEVYEAHAILGALCSGATLEAARRVAIPNNTVMLTPASTSPSLSTLDDRDLVFRVAVSDAYQGEVMARLLAKKGIRRIAVSYIDNDYGNGFFNALTAAFSDLGGRVAAAIAHTEEEPDFAAQIETLADSGTNTLVILAEARGSGTRVLEQALTTETFANYVIGDRMIDDSVISAVGANPLQFLLATQPVMPHRAQADSFNDLMREAGNPGTNFYAAHAYDAAFVLALALERQWQDKSLSLSQALRDVSGSPGSEIGPGEWERALALLSAGEEIDYQGASGDLEFDANGDVAGTVMQVGVSKGSFTTFRQLY
ncbi:MAG: ABC transporter substrate-binding protein [Pseudomonadota bacterium]